MASGFWDTCIKVESPYTGREIASLQTSSQADVEQSVAAAYQAFPSWSSRTLKERSVFLQNFRTLLLENIEALSNTAALESGKTVAEARAGIIKGVEVIDFAMSLQNLDSGALMEVSRGVTCQYSRRALGVVVGVTPFNFPAMVPLWLFPIAVTLGNCFVLKPSEKVPCTAVRMGELMVEAGYPAGVFSVLQGARETVEAVVSHPQVRAVAFVGSSKVAQHLYSLASGLGKRALCLGGAKNHLIVVPDADSDITVDGVVSSFTGCAGQRCMAGSVLVAVGDVESIISRICDQARAIQMGSTMGALITTESRDRILGEIAKAEAQGAKVVLDGRGVTAPKAYPDGFWLAPTILDGVTEEMDCLRTELFGPVLSVVRVDTLDQAMRLEAASEYGNATSVFTTSGEVASLVSQRATSGMIGVNIGVPVPREPFSFGGTKASKFGHGDITGVGVLDFWSDTRKITSKWTKLDKPNWMS